MSSKSPPCFPCPPWLNKVLWGKMIKLLTWELQQQLSYQERRESLLCDGLISLRCSSSNWYARLKSGVAGRRVYGEVIRLRATRLRRDGSAYGQEKLRVAGNWWRVCEGKFVGFLGIAVDLVLKRGETMSFYVLKKATEMLFSRHV